MHEHNNIEIAIVEIDFMRKDIAGIKNGYFGTQYNTFVNTMI